MKMHSIAGKPVRYAIGLSAGASCYGIQAALVRLKGSGADLHVKFIRCEQVPFRPAFRSRLLNPRPEVREIALLNYELGEILADGALRMIKVAQDENVEVDFVGLEGNVLSHLPPRASDPHGMFQIGEPTVVADRTGLPVVSDFAQRDMAAGGQGTSVTAYADWVLFGRADRIVARLHLGGVSTLSVVTPRMENVLAFDVGPGTLALDGAIHLATSGTADIDKGGEVAGRGRVIDELLERLLQHRYFERVPPKSTSKHEFGAEAYLREALDDYRNRSADDLVATVTEAVAANIVDAYKRFIGPQYRVTRMVVSGGGALNATLMQRLQQGLSDVVFRLTEQYGLPLTGCDAVSSAILANETLSGLAANIPKATGARYAAVLGKITPN